MPRVKSVSIIEQPETRVPKVRRHKASEAGGIRVTRRKPRRSPHELIAELKARREALARTYQARLAKLDSRIERLESRYEKKLMLARLLESKTPEELAQELAAIKKQQALIKKALKIAR